MKSEQADLVVSAVERFAQMIPLNLQEIFVWYFEQKGVDNPERFLGVGVKENGEQTSFPRPLGEGVLSNPQQALSQVGQALPDNNLNPENPINQIIKLMSQTKKNFDISDVISKLKNKKTRKDK